MKLRNLTIACGGLALAGVSSLAAADSSFSGNVALTTDYVWRGISQTDNGPAVQGGFDWEHSSGLSAGVWASNVDFGADPEVKDASSEFDFYGGYGFDLGDLGLSVGTIYYSYPSEGDLNFWEVNVGASYGFINGMISYSDEAFGDGGPNATYYELGSDFDLPVGGLALGAHVGYYDIDAADADYTDWKIGLSKEIGGFGFELAYTDTDLSDDECGSNICDARAVFTVSKAL